MDKHKESVSEYVRESRERERREKEKKGEG